MAGEKQSKEKLNHTLLFIVELLKKNNITNWFLGYGTLLGIVRDNSCIDNDDDIDIIIDKKYYDTLKKILTSIDFEILDIDTKTRGPVKDKNKKTAIITNKILKTKNTEKYTSIDFYMSEVNEKGDFYDSWERTRWNKCYNEKNELIKQEWNGNIVQFPFNYKIKLFHRYGSDWRIPKNSKCKHLRTRYNL